MELVSERVLLRPPVDADAGEVAAAVQASLTEVAPWMPWATTGYYAEAALGWVRGETGDAHRFVMIDPHDDAIVGSCGLTGSTRRISRRISATGSAVIAPGGEWRPPRPACWPGSGSTMPGSIVSRSRCRRATRRVVASPRRPGRATKGSRSRRCCSRVSGMMRTSGAWSRGTRSQLSGSVVG